MLELEALAALASDIQTRGASLVVISPQVNDASKETAEKLELPFPVLSDTDNTVAGQFGLVFTLPGDLKVLYQKFGIDLEKANGNTDWQLPAPARFIVDQQGQIIDSTVNADYTRRAEPLEVIDILKSL